MWETPEQQVEYHKKRIALLKDLTRRAKEIKGDSLMTEQEEFELVYSKIENATWNRTEDREDYYTVIGPYSFHLERLGFHDSYRLRVWDKTDKRIAEFFEGGGSRLADLYHKIEDAVTRREAKAAEEPRRNWEAFLQGDIDRQRAEIIAGWRNWEY